MNPLVIQSLKKDNFTKYLKENSQYIKELHRNPLNYEKFKKEIKEKYNLRFQDKLSNIVNDIEIVSSIINNIN